MSPRRYKRTQYLVDREYQVRFATRVIAIVLAVALLSSLIAAGVLWFNMHQPEIADRSVVAAAAIGVTTVLCIQLLLAIPIIFYLGIRQSHHVVGPLNRMKAVLEAIRDGDFSKRLTLRKGDAMPEIADAINQMAESLQNRYAKPSGS